MKASFWKSNPVTVTLIDRGNRDLSYAMPAEGPDPWDNDQYAVLYFMLCNSDLLDK